MNVYQIGFSLRCLAASTLIVVSGAAFAQTGAPAGAKSPAKKSAPSTAPSQSTTQKPSAPTAATGQWRRQCLKEGDFCVQVPAAWKSFGDVYEGAGFTVGEPDAQRAPENLNQITAAYIQVPQEGDKPRPSTSELIDIVLGSPVEGTTQETIERSREVVAGMPTEIVKIKLHSATGDWVEKVALLDADEVVYAIALVCAPQDAERLEPVFRHVLESWTPIPVSPKK